MKKRKRGSKSSHNQLVRAVIEGVNLSGEAYVWKMQSGLFKNWRGEPVGSIGVPGVPDVCGLTRKGRFLGIEVKILPDKQNKSQVEFEKACDKAGAIYLLFDDTDELDVFIECIKSFNN